jgi:galactose mutarotase-like enzyme
MKLAEEVVLSAGGLQATLVPRFGAHVRQFSAAGRELLAQAGRRTDEAATSRDFVASNMGGLDDCLPTVTPVDDFGGSPVVSHGEVWYRPAEVEVLSENVVVASIRGECVDYRLERSFRLTPDGLTVEYELDNPRDQDLRVLWAAHPLFAPSPGCFLTLPRGRWSVYSASTPEFGVSLTAPSTRIDGQVVDLSRWEDLPTGTYAKLFVLWPESEDAKLTHPRWDLRITIRHTDAPTDCYLGLWLNRGGFPPQAPLSHIAIEPTFGSTDDLSLAIHDRSCLTVPAGQRATWRVAYDVSSVS